jgi:hypothetical protein
VNEEALAQCGTVAPKKLLSLYAFRSQLEKFLVITYEGKAK